MPLPDSFFTASPGWSWLVIFYFFLGGIAGGSYFLAALLTTFGSPAGRQLARIGYYVAFPAALLCAPLLILDLTRPERFWHMLLQSQTGWPSLKYWSPMSIGAWALLIFSAFAFVSFVDAVVESNRLPWRLFPIIPQGRIRQVFATVGGLSGFFLASYTGVLLSVTNRPIWADSNLIGLLFLSSAGSTSAALLILLGRKYLASAAADSLRWMHRMDNWVMLLELAVLAIFIISLGTVARVYLSLWGTALALGVVLLGNLIPLVLHWRPRLFGSASIPAASLLALTGGLILRVVIVFSAQSI
jgi:protein NrfD